MDRELPMNTQRTIEAELIKALRGAAGFNEDLQVAPACILWPDRDRQWEAVIPRLRGLLPELLTLGDYAPQKRSGPAIWLRCAIAGTIDDIALPAENIPILYLPGVARQDLRAVENCPEHLKPLAELQYRGTIWSQVNAKDWTLLAFLKSDQGGLGLDVAQDNDTKTAMQLSLHRLLDEELALLKGKRLDKDFFNTLLTGGDPVRDLLQWLDQGDAFRQTRSESEWKAFVEVCKSQLAFNPQAEGILSGAAKLAGREGAWQVVWTRYCEAPKRYPHIPAQIRKCQLPSFDLFADMDVTGAWPQWNEAQEESLRQRLQAICALPPHEARRTLLELEKQHAPRRQLVWVELGESPLAMALEWLAVLAQVTSQGLAAGAAADLAAGYAAQGWRADDALLQALAGLTKAQDLESVAPVIRTIYLPWAEDSARHLQKVWEQGRLRKSDDKAPDQSGRQCLLFVDGLRFDCAKRLAQRLAETGAQVNEKILWAALPSVTGTGKPAAAPLYKNSGIAEEPAPYNFEPVTPYQFKKLLNACGWTVLEKNQACPGPSEVDPPRLWVEFGDIDHEGHSRGWKLAKHLEVLLGEICERIAALSAAGWTHIEVVTDHGWLLLPGGLPKTDLPSALTDTKWGRCAVVKEGAATQERLFPWYWNPNHCFALADGLSCFRKGEEYAHGGLSLQESLLLELTVSFEGSAQVKGLVEITDVAWKGLRCLVAVETECVGLSLDVRAQAGDPSSSLVMSTKPFKENGTASVVVVDEEMEGREAILVVTDDTGALVAQIATIIGGGES